MISRVAVTDREAEVLEQILSEYLPGAEVWAFGSRTNGRCRAGSDLDLAVVTEDGLSISIRSAIEEAFSESELPFRVDLVDLASASEGFQKLVRHSHVPLTRWGASSH